MSVDEFQNLYAATYGAVFALFVRDFMAERGHAPDDSDYEWFDEEADFIAQRAAMLRKQKVVRNAVEAEK